LEAATSSMVSCSAGGEEDRAILLAAAAVLAAHDDETGAQHLLQALPVDNLRADTECRWDICEPYLRHVVATASDDPGFASDSLAGYALERLEKLPELVAR